MNKLVKGAIAGGAGIILLMGGAGSLAYWNDTANAGPGAGSNTITAGTLTITAANAGSWTKGFYDASGAVVTAPAAVANLANVRIVPGNKLVYTQNFNVVGTGDDLYFRVTSTPGAVSGASGADAALAAQLNASSFVVSSVSGGTVVNSTTAGTYKVSSNAGTAATISVTWTIDFPFGASAVNTAKTGAVTLSQGSVTLTQVAAP